MARQAVRLNSLTRDRAHQARRARRARRDQGLRRLRGPTACATNYPPYHQSVLHEVTPDLRDAARLEVRPHRGQRIRRDADRGRKSYVRFLEETTGVPISVVGVGPGREQFVRTA